MTLNTPVCTGAARDVERRNAERAVAYARNAIQW